MEYNSNGLEIKTNCAEGSVYTIGVVGIDVIKIIGFHLPTVFTEPVYDDLHMRPHATKSLQELNTNCEYVACEEKKVKIDKTDSCGYKFSYGNTNAYAYAILELHSNRGNGDNLISMSMDDVYAHFNVAYQDLLDNYEIELPYDYESLRVKYAEITKTFPIAKEFPEYDRILNTMSWALSSTRKNYKGKDANMSASKWSGKKNTKETNVLLYGSTTQVSIYDKSKELMQKMKKAGKNAKKNSNRQPPCFDSKLMRVEIATYEQNLSSMSPSGNKKTYLKDLTDAAINNYYTSYFHVVFDKIDTYMAEQWNWEITGKNDDSTDNLSFLACNTILPILQVNAKVFIENLLQSYTHEERDQVPRLLDIKDLLGFLSHTQYLSNLKFLDNLRTEIDNMIANNNILIMPFVGQRELYQELQNKIMNPIEAHMYYVGNHILWLENPERNPVPSELLFLSNSDDDRIYATNTMPPVYFTEKIIHQRAGKTGRVTSTEKIIHFLTNEEINYARRNAEQQLEAWIEAYENAHGDYDDGEDDNYYN